jgi:hypothetical protein
LLSDWSGNLHPLCIAGIHCIRIQRRFSVATIDFGSVCEVSLSLLLQWNNPLFQWLSQHPVTIAP